MSTRREWIAKLLGLSFTNFKFVQGETTPSAIQQRRFIVPLTDSQGMIVSRYTATANYFTEILGDGVTLDMAIIPGGSYEMGSMNTPPTTALETPIHRVTIKPFALATFQVTKGLWKRLSSLPQVSLRVQQPFATGLPLEEENALAMDYVSWPESVEVIKRLQNYTGRKYRFPTEAEWEYACKAGTATKYHFGDGISLQVANYNDGILRPVRVKPVGSKQCPNRFGLHDMHGNVLEWCSDQSHDTYSGAPSDGSSWDFGANNPLSRIGRGGMFLWNANSARTSARNRIDVREQASGFGLRLALDFPVLLQDPRITVGDFSNAASGLSVGIAPGMIVTIRGDSIGPALPLLFNLNEKKTISADLQGTQVLFDGVAAPLLYVSNQQINAVAPYSLAGKNSTEVIVVSQGQGSLPITIPVKESNPGLFTANSSGRGQGAIINQDGSYNAPASPAPRGSIVSLFGTGEGQTEPRGEDGKILDLLTRPVLPVSITIGGRSAEVKYAGGAPSLVAGVLQLNVRIPEESTAGNQEVLVRIGSETSQGGVFISVS